MYLCRYLCMYVCLCVRVHLPPAREFRHTQTHTRRPVSRSTKTVRKPYENRKRLLRKTLGNGNENVNFLFQDFKAFKPPKENYGFRCGFIWLCLMKRVKRPPTVFVRFSYGFRTVFVGLRVFQRFLITACCCEDIF